jgi:hypothetical protein
LGGAGGGTQGVGPEFKPQYCKNTKTKKYGWGRKRRRRGGRGGRRRRKCLGMWMEIICDFPSQSCSSKVPLADFITLSQYFSFYSSDLVT